MNSPVDMILELQDAAIAALKSAFPGILVTHSLPLNSKPPYVLVAEVTSTDDSTRDGQGEQLELEIHYVYRGTDRAELIAMAHTGRLALDRQPIAGDTVEFFPPRWVRGVVSRAAPDGVTYLAIQIFETFGQPADD